MRRTLVLGLLLAVVSLGAGLLVFRAMFPSEDEIQRYSLEELAEGSPLLGLILEEPVIRAFIEDVVDTSSDRVSDRVLEESREAMIFGGVTIVLLTAGGVALIAVDHRRRHDGAGAPAGPAEPAATAAPAPPDPVGRP
jgi:hypothetical protein